MSNKKVPALKLNDYLSKDKKTRDKFVKNLYNSFKEYGFVVLKDHSIDPALLDKAADLQKKLFDLPLETKMKYKLDNGGARGYTPYKTEYSAMNKDKTLDLKEFYHVGRDHFSSETDRTAYPANAWVNELPELKVVFNQIYSELEKMGDLVFEALEPSLGMKKGFFKKLTADSNSVLRLLHYPPVPEGADPAAIRAFQHTDINTITMLVAKGGLELLDKSGKWLPVQAGEGGHSAEESLENDIVVNIGDMLSRICNDEIPSTLHRVVNPHPSKNTSRYSIPFFLHFKNDVILNVLPKFKNKDGDKFPVITAGEFLNERLKAIGLKK